MGPSLWGHKVSDTTKQPTHTPQHPMGDVSFKLKVSDMLGTWGPFCVHLKGKLCAHISHNPFLKPIIKI